MMESVVIIKPQDLLGVVVIPKRGRDADRPCVILDWQSDVYALIADGKKRTVSKPKKKNMKHLVFTDYRSGELYEKLVSGEHVTDLMIREALAAWQKAM
jgi:ribosomal protein L14E/L6E/L27E